MKRSLFILIVIVWSVQALAAAQLKLISPNGGERICLGQAYRIAWQAVNVSQKVKLVLKRNNGVIVGMIASDLNAGDLAYDWKSAGKVDTGEAPEGADYVIRLATMDGSLADASDAAFELKHCNGLVTPGGQLQTVKPVAQFTPVNQPPIHLINLPKLQIVDLKFNCASKQFEAWVKNVGNASFVGHFHWRWITDCGDLGGTKDIPPEQSASLENGPGIYFHFPCIPDAGACSVHASLSIDPFTMPGTHLESSSMEGNFPCFAYSQFLMSDRRVMLEFLRGSHWVNCSYSYVITSEDVFDYDPAAQTASFWVGFPVKNCGGEAGRTDHDMNQKLYWSVIYTPSNAYAVYPNSVSNGENYSATPLEPGQGILIDRALSLKVQPGIYMLHVRAGSDPAGIEYCIISIRFADNLIH